MAKKIEEIMATHNVQRILDKLKPNEKDELYRVLWFEHMKKDASSKPLLNVV